MYYFVILYYWDLSISYFQINDNPTMTDRTSKNLSKFPKYGWKFKLDQQFPEYRDQNLKPSIKQIIPLIPLGFRFIKWWAKKVIINKYLIHLLKNSWKEF